MADDWYTPEEVTEFVYEVLGEIWLDPCSSDEANQHIGAKRYWTIEDDALTKLWEADTVFMNPPYSKPKPFIKRFELAYSMGDIGSGIMLLKGDPSTTWWDIVRQYPHVWIPNRLKFIGPKDQQANFPSALIYLGDEVDKFKLACQKRGWIAMGPL